MNTRFCKVTLPQPSVPTKTLTFVMHKTHFYINLQDCSGLLHFKSLIVLALFAYTCIVCRWLTYFSRLSSHTIKSVFSIKVFTNV